MRYQRYTGCAILIGLVSLFLCRPGLAGDPIFVSCGDLIVQDTVLANDLIDCPGNGLIIAADRVTLDLNSHVVDGTGSGVGIDNSAGHQRVTITGGVVKDFLHGVRLQGATLNRISKLNIFDISGVGIRLQWTNQSRVEKNVIFGVVLEAILLGAANDNIVEKNVYFNGSEGIWLTSSDRNLIKDNWAANCRYISLMLDWDSSNNRVEDNTFVENPYGIWVHGADDSIIVRNRAYGSTQDGIFIAPDSPGTVVERNVTNGNGDDGIETRDAAATITRNVALGNGDLGIEAVPGVTDGGGNKARGNENPLQCTNVACE